jgi:hypothetical protein
MPAGELVVTLDPLEIEPDPQEILRYLGYPANAAVNAGVHDRLLAAIETSRAWLHPRGTYSLYRVSRHGRRSLTLAGNVTFTGSVGEYLGGAERVAAFLATAGPEVTHWADETLRSRDTLGGLIFNALGSQLAEAVVERLLEDLRGRAAPGEALTFRYSPGYCGISLSQQRTLFRLVEADRIGVELLPTLIMKPLKSVSGLVGIGPKDVVAAYGNPCDRCPLLDCRMRR